MFQADSDDTNINDDGDDVVTPKDLDDDPTTPPAVEGEADVFSGDAPEESADIDEEMKKVGKDIDPEHPEPLGEE